MKPRFILLVILISAFLFQNSVSKALAASPGVIFDDSLNPDWVSWSWGSSVNFGSSAPVQSGAKSIGLKLYSWGAVYLHSDKGIDLSGYKSLDFALYVTGTFSKLKVLFYDVNNQTSSTQLDLTDFGGSPTANSWKSYSIPVASISEKFIRGFALQEVAGPDSIGAGDNLPILYLDNIQFVTIPAPPAERGEPVPTPQPAPTTSTQPLFEDNLVNGWMNWSWGSNIDFSSGNVYSGSKAIDFNIYSPWAGFYIHNDTPVNSSGFASLHLAIKATQAGEKFSIALYGDNNQLLKNFTPLDSYGELPANTWKVFDIPLADLNASNVLIKGLALQESLGQVQSNLYLDEIRLMSPTAQSAPVKPLTGFIASNNKIAKNGNQVVLHGVNWFGAETTTYVPHGLWARNWKDMILQMKALGFNSVRLPFCPATLKGAGVSSIDYWKNPDLVNLNSLQIFDKIVGEFNNQGMYILIDHHRPDCQAISEAWYTGSYSEDAWIADLKFVAQRYAGLTNFIGIDLKNEPHGSATWGTGNLQTDWNKAAERAGQAVLSVNPNLLVFIEGIADSHNCSSSLPHFWGGNLEPQKCAPINLPKEKLIFSPHIYGPDVSWQSYFGDANFPNNMPEVWETQFGFLTNSGFTLVPGEWGGKMGTSGPATGGAGGNVQDLKLQQALVSYLINKHICNSFYWSWNPNSGDTGGILQDDWLNPWSVKISVIKNYFQTCY